MQCDVSVWMQRLNNNLAGDNFAREKNKRKKHKHRMEPTRSIPSSCVPQSLGTWSCQMTTRHGVHILAVINVALRDVSERSVLDPLASLPMKLGWADTSMQRKRSAPTVLMFPSGSSSLIFIVDGANVVNSFVTHSPIS